MSIESPINLDRNATYGVLPEVSETLRALDWGYLGNPSSIHQSGQRARYLIEEARGEILTAVGAEPADRIIFTSGATESNNMVVLGAALRKSCHIVTTAIEHPALLEAAKEAGARGADVTIVPVDKTGAASFEQLKNGIHSRTGLVTLMYANNETGALQPVSEIGEHLRNIGSPAIFHSDAVQALGKSDFSFSKLKLDLASISAHKIGGLPGVGALVAKAGLELTPLLFGGPQEKRARAGTENVLGIVSFGAAARILNRQRDDRIQRLRTNREIIWSVLRDSLENIKPTVDLGWTLPNTLSLFIKDIDSADLVVGLDLEGVEISSGAACASGKPGASHVLTGMGYSEQEARSIIRISVGAEDDSSRMESAAKTIVRVVQRMRHGK